MRMSFQEIVSHGTTVANRIVATNVQYVVVLTVRREPPEFP